MGSERGTASLRRVAATVRRRHFPGHFPRDRPPRAPTVGQLRALSDPGASARIAPFCAVWLLALLLAVLPADGSTDVGTLAWSAGASGVLIAAAVGVPWSRLPARAGVIVPLGAFVVVALTRDATGGVASGYAPLVLLPILWTALYCGRAELWAAIGGTALVLFVPLATLGPPNYPSSSWRGAVLWVVIGLLAGTSIQSLVARARQRTADVAALGAVTRALTVGADPRPELCAAAQLVTGAAFATLFEPRDGILVATAGTGGVDATGLRIDPSAEVSATAEAWRTGERIYIPNVRSDPRASSRLAELTGATAALFQPVTREGRRTAVLVAGFTRSRPRMPELALYMVELVAAEIAAALDRADLVELLAAQARTDPLTGAANRRSWDEQMAREVARARRAGEPLTVALLDMDHFKAYNDTFGHDAGDVLLRDLVVAARGELRPEDVIARWGGEEFAIALPRCALEAASEVASRLLAIVPGGQTASIGLTEAGPLDTPRSLIGRADRALYAAKDAGRNRVCTLPAPADAAASTSLEDAPA